MSLTAQDLQSIREIHLMFSERQKQMDNMQINMDESLREPKAEVHGAFAFGTDQTGAAL